MFYNPGLSNLNAQQILFGSSGGGVQQSSNLVWDEVAKTLRISGTNSTLSNATPGGNLNISTVGNSGGAGGTINITGGNALLAGSAGGYINVIAGNGSGAGAGADVALVAGNGGATGIGGFAVFVGGNGGTTSGDAGGFTASAGAPFNGNGGPCQFFASAAGGVGPKNGGNCDFFVGASAGAGTRGYLTFNISGGGTYGVANGVGVVTRGNVGPVALSIAVWIPVMIDGVLTYIEGYR